MSALGGAGEGLDAQLVSFGLERETQGRREPHNRVSRQANKALEKLQRECSSKGYVVIGLTLAYRGNAKSGTVCVCVRGGTFGVVSSDVGYTGEGVVGVAAGVLTGSCVRGEGVLVQRTLFRPPEGSDEP